MTEDVKSQLDIALAAPTWAIARYHIEIAKFNLENPQLIQPCAYREIVAVALYFAPEFITDDAIVGYVMSALGGKANPITLREEIKKQRGT